MLTIRIIPETEALDLAISFSIIRPRKLAVRSRVEDDIAFIVSTISPMRRPNAEATARKSGPVANQAQGQRLGRAKAEENWHTRQKSIA